MKHFITAQNTIRAFESDGSQDHLITDDMKEVTLPDAPSAAWVIDHENGSITVDQAIVDQINNPVPQVVSSRQGLQQLIIEGLDTQVEQAIAAIVDETQRKLTQAWYDKASTWERDNAELIQLGTSLGLTSDQIDQLFRDASNL